MAQLEHIEAMESIEADYHDLAIFYWSADGKKGTTPEEKSRVLTHLCRFSGKNSQK